MGTNYYVFMKVIVKAVPPNKKKQFVPFLFLGTKVFTTENKKNLCRTTDRNLGFKYRILSLQITFPRINFFALIGRPEKSYLEIYCLPSGVLFLTKNLFRI